MVRILTGIHRPDRGSVRFSLDGAPWQPGRRDLGYLPEERGLYADATVRRLLAYLGELRGLSRADARRASDAWLERLELAERADEAVKTLSKGNQQKVQLIVAVLHAPRLAILDEPFSGLDPLNQELFCELIRELAAGGTTVVLSAHQMALVERLADRVLLIAGGREVLAGTVDALKRSGSESARLRLRVRGVPELLAPPAGLGLERIERVDGGNDLVLHLSHEARASAVVRWAAERFELESIRSEEVSLHDVYVERVRGAARDGSLAGGSTDA
jgi:ABC-2 type transport system ATP-binding protein